MLCKLMHHYKYPAVLIADHRKDWAISMRQFHTLINVTWNLDGTVGSELNPGLEVTDHREVPSMLKYLLQRLRNYEQKKMYVII